MLTSALSLADAEGDVERCASLHARVARELYEHGDTTGAESHIESAMAALPDEAAAASRGAVLADVGRLLMIMTRFEESLKACEQVVAMGAAVEPRALARALTTIGAVLGQTGRVDEALPRFEEARRVAVEAGDGYELGRYYGNLAMALSYDDQYARAREVTLEGIAAMDRLGLERSMGASLRHNLAVDEIWTGHPSEARRLIQENVELGAKSIDAADDQVLLGAASSLLGDHEAAAAAFALARTMVHRGSRTTAEADLMWNLADEAAWVGDFEGARASIEAGLKICCVPAITSCGS